MEIRIKWLGHSGRLLGPMPPLDVLLALDNGRLVVANASDVTTDQPRRLSPDEFLEQDHWRAEAEDWMRNACAWIEEAFGWALDNAVLHRCPDVFTGARALIERCPAQPKEGGAG